MATKAESTMVNEINATHIFNSGMIFTNRISIEVSCNIPEGDKAFS